VERSPSDTQDRDLDSDRPAAGEPLSRLTHASLQERVYQELRNAIRGGRFASGEVLTIRGLADMLGTSAMPVREAVRRLVQETTLEALPNRSTRVPLLSPTRFDELTDVRATLEGHAAYLAAERMSDADYAEIMAANDLMNRELERDDLPSAIAANERFHFGIYRAARSQLLLTTIETLWQQGGPYLAALVHAMSKTPKAPPNLAIIHHFELLAALGSRNAAAAQAAITADIIDSARWYRDSIAFNETDQEAQ
jgi:DNA-binding GntR family transcriptional regulator